MRQIRRHRRLFAKLSASLRWVCVLGTTGRAYPTTNSKRFTEAKALCARFADSPPKNTKSTHLDHCHTSGRIRGVLCASCNKGLGHFKDDPDLVKRAAHYIETADTGYVVPEKYTKAIPSSAPKVTKSASRSSPLRSIGDKIPGGQSDENR